MTVDVFTAVPYQGNPVSVVLDATGLDTAQMQAFARWTNLSETTFVLPPSEAARAQGADYQVRIFTPVGEMPFAGHPTLGTCHAWLAHGGQPQAADRVVQECAKGLITIERSSNGLAFANPTTRALPLPAQLHKIYEAIGIHTEQVVDAAYLDNGPHWLCLLLDSTDTVLSLEPDLARIKALGHKVGVAALYDDADATPLIGRACREAEAFSTGLRARSASAQAQLEVRAFSTTGMEDPVTGSLNGCLAQWLIEQGHLNAPYIANQGACVGRDGWISLRQDAAQQLWVGGHVVLCVQGEVFL
ncbi:MAG: PhzF family phenazine biosynthesis protein [Comamonas sp.]|nr:PhzF family phenazine biosynthesis protein [Comamonas sp.]